MSQENNLDRPIEFIGTVWGGIAITCAVTVLGLVAVAIFGWIARPFQERHKLRERVAELEAELRALRQADLKRRSN